MPSTCALIAAAGRGTRAGLPYPKTLFAVQGQPILLRVIAALAPHADEVVVIASPDGAKPIEECLGGADVAARIAIQQTPRGMGDAVLIGAAEVEADHILLAWGDIPFFQPATVAAMVSAHHAHGNDFTFATARVDSAYTIVSRDDAGRVTDVIESREAELAEPGPGERDIGLFIFRREPVLAKLREDLPGKFGKTTGEHGFLYAIRHLAEAGFKVEAVPVATELDLVSLNSLGDLKGYI
jgi:bifunctional N-acetylglucosamine-1-phosphate-uridyltransferase/glucosamine-1-phosphate-acetyltransferase GlmU-like protein